MKLDEQGLPVFEDEDFAMRMSETEGTLRSRANHLLHAFLKAQPRVSSKILSDNFDMWAPCAEPWEEDTHTAYLVGIRKIGDGE